MQRKRKRRVKCFAPQNACRCGPLLGSNGDFTAAGIASCPRKRRRTLAQARSSPLPCHSKTRIRPNENMTIPRNSSFLVVSCVLGEGGIWGSHTPLGAIRAIGWYYQNQALPRRKAEVHSQGEVRMDPRHPFGTHRAVAELSGIWTCLQARLPRCTDRKNKTISLSDRARRGRSAPRRSSSVWRQPRRVSPRWRQASN